MTIRNPATDGQLTSNDAEGSRSCVAYSASYLVSWATRGRVFPSGNAIRDWTGDHSGGLEPLQVDLAIARHTGIDLDTKVMTLSQLQRDLNKDFGFILLGGYRPLARSRFFGQRGSTNFNHGIALLPDTEGGDPLTDGRVSGSCGCHVYRWHGENYGWPLIKDFAAHLVLSNGRLAGGNHFEVSALKRVPGGTAPPPPATGLHVHFDGGTIGYYRANPSTMTYGDITTMTGRNPFTARCTAPRRYVKLDGRGRIVNSRRLVRITSGFAKNRYVNLGNDRVHLIA